jgi:3-(methylsulfanyl)propanoyl-CoA dehydrogenase
LTLAKFFNERMLPETSAHLMRLSAGAATLMALPAEAF